MVADYYLVKRQQVVLDDLYTMSPNGSLYFEQGWNRTALFALAGSGTVSIGLALLGAYAVIPNIGDWGWLIGASLGAVLYVALMRPREVPSPFCPRDHLAASAPWPEDGAVNPPASLIQMIAKCLKKK